MSFYLPVASATLALALLATWLVRDTPAPRPWAAIVVTLGLWALSWVLLMVILQGVSSGVQNNAVTSLRDAGYWAGSAAFPLLPFLAVLGACRLLRSTAWPLATRRIAALCVAAAGGITVPWLFFVGWLAGCVAVGYHSCL